MTSLPSTDSEWAPECGYLFPDTSKCCGYLISYAQKIYIKETIILEDDTYLSENYTKQTTSDKSGYNLYLINN